MRAFWIVVLSVTLVAAVRAGEPRAPLPKFPVAVPAPADLMPGFVPLEYQLAVKFTDAAGARATADGGVESRSGADLAAVRTVAERLGLSFSPHIRLPEEALSALQQRAAQRSGVDQPDLAGLLRVRVKGAGGDDPVRLAAAGNALLPLAAVEFVSLQPMGAPPPGDLLPPTPDLTDLQTYKGRGPGMNAEAANAAGFDGAGRRLSDCEYGWVATHEDLNDFDLHLEPGQTIHPTVIANGWDEHGTAVLGETSCSPNAYGCTGMAAGAAVYTFPEWSVQEGFRIVTCITNAIAGSEPGDVVLLEMQSGAGGPVETDPAVWLVVKLGTDAGVVVVGAAGNSNQNLDGLAYLTYAALGDSGAVIVGAGSSSTAHDKLGFSSYGSRVNVQGWGENVASLGYGDFAQYGGDKNQRYTAGFSGTSSASPFVASACLILQQVAEEQLGQPLPPAVLRQLLIDTGVPQGTGGHIGPFVDCSAAMAPMLPWKNLGNGLRGALAEPPVLQANGTLVGGTPWTLALHGAAPLAPCTLFLGLTAIDAPFKGGTLVPAPDAVLIGLLTGLDGSVSLTGAAPPAMPPGMVVYLQQWLVDLAAPHGLAASNALSATFP